VYLQATENATQKVKMERELARVQNMLQGLSQQGEKLSQQMSTIRRSSSGTKLKDAFGE
jgi:predicted  nucleic acid-binding Zn-ribbon protein